MNEEIISFYEFAKISRGSSKNMEDLLYDYSSYCKKRLELWKLNYNKEKSENIYDSGC